MKQVTQLHKEYDKLQLKHGDSNLSSTYGAGCIEKPEIMFIFMNPTGRNISANPNWRSIRAPWISTKQVWSIFKDLDLLTSSIYSQIVNLKPDQWDCNFAEEVYTDIEEHSVYITNLAKCTQIDARPLSNNVFQEYLELMFKEIGIVKPKKIVTFGNQVSSILLSKNISVSNYTNLEKEVIRGYDIYPTYYPVGQGRRNMPLAIERIKKIMVEYIR